MATLWVLLFIFYQRNAYFSRIINYMDKKQPFFCKIAQL